MRGFRRPPMRALVPRSTTVSLVTALVSTLLAAPPDAGAEPGPPLSMVETLLLYVGAPVGLFVLISLLTVAPSIVRSGRGTFGGWLSEPVWFGGPSDPHASAAPPERAGAVESAHASAPASATGQATATGPAAASEQAGGGASARW